MTVSHRTVERGQQDQVSEDSQIPPSCDKNLNHTHLERLLLDAGSKIQQSLDAIMSGSNSVPAKSVPTPPPMDLTRANERLLWAAEHGDLETLLLALRDGADINGKDAPHSKTALHWAAENGHIDITAVLLESGGSVASTDKYFETPLHYAADSGHAKLVELLLLYGSDPAANDHRRRTALWCARDKDRVEVVRVLLPSWSGREHELEDMDNQTRTLIHWAAELGFSICPRPAREVESSDERGRFPVVCSLKKT